MFSYTVRCAFQDQAIAVKWLEWLEAEHIADVLNAGATSAEIFQMDGVLTYEIRYRFESRSHFEIYERDHAPRLRNDGLDRFPLALGLEYSRCCGQSLVQFKMSNGND